MWPPIFVRKLSEEEKQQLKAGLRSPDSFTLRRCQILLASSAGQPPSLIAANLGCVTASVRNAIHAFGADGLDSLKSKSRAPKAPHAIWPKERDEELRELLRQSPRTVGRPRSLWTLALIAEVCHERGITDRQLSGEAIRRILERMDIDWKSCKHWMTSPDPNYAAKKARRERLIRLAAGHPDWVLCFEDEVWWSRLARPRLKAWTAGEPQKVQLLQSDDNDPDPDAIACYGLLRMDTHKVLLRFAEGRPLANLSTQFLEWASQIVSKEGKRVLIVIWDDASWHTADSVTLWVRDHNQRAGGSKQVKIVICELPVASPWLNNIEPCRTHAKKNILEPDRKLTAQETVTRVCKYFGCEELPYLKPVEDCGIL